jgi:hypothetical protein
MNAIVTLKNHILWKLAKVQNFNSTGGYDLLFILIFWDRKAKEGPSKPFLTITVIFSPNLSNLITKVVPRLEFSGGRYKFWDLRF